MLKIKATIAQKILECIHTISPDVDMNASDIAGWLEYPPDVNMGDLSVAVDGKPGLTTGIVYSNFFLDSVGMVITDSEGKEVFNHRMFTTVSKYWDDGGRTDLVIRMNNHKYDLGHFAAPLQNVMFELGKEYHCVITAHVGGERTFVVKDFTFTNGTAQ